MNQTYKISESTKFPIIDNGEELTVSANTLLHNIQLILDKDKSREIQESQHKILSALEETSRDMKYCVKTCTKAQSMARTSYNWSDKIYDTVLTLVNKVSELEKKNKNLEERLYHLEQHKENLDLVTQKESIDNDRLQSIENTLKTMLNPKEGDIVVLGVIPYQYQLGTWIQQ